MRIAASVLSLLLLMYLSACRPKYHCVEKRGPRPDSCEGTPVDEYPEYYMYLGNSPGGYRYNWTENIQGVAHDKDNWFFTQSTKLWKIPVTEYLADENMYGMETRTLEELGLPEPYDHFGDIDYAEHNGVGYVFAPVTGGGATPIIAAINVETLELAAFSRLRAEMSCGWCAIREEAAGTRLYTSRHIAPETPIEKYHIDWSALEAGAEFLSIVDTPFRLWNGDTQLEIQHMQGGAFSSGNRLYLVNGYCRNFNEDDGKIWVFDATDEENGYLIDRSLNGQGTFNYEWRTNCENLCVCDEPEGITIWDLDDGRAPCVAGQIHVLMIDNESSRGDRLYFKHYTTSPMDQCKI